MQPASEGRLSGAPAASDGQRSLDNTYRASPDAHSFKAAARNHQGKHDGARASHFLALFDDPPMRAVGQPIEAVHDTRQANGRRSGRRILGDAELRREHTRVEVGVVVHTLPRIEIDAVDLVI